MRSLERPRNHPDGGKMLKWILKKWEWRKEAECVWCRIGASEGLIWAQYWIWIPQSEDLLLVVQSGTWEGKDNRESQIMYKWSEPETFCKYGVKLQDDGLNAERCKSKMTEQFENSWRPPTITIFDEYYAQHKYNENNNIEKCSYNKSQRAALFHKFIWVKNSTCLEKTYCPSPELLILYSQQFLFVILVMLTVC